MDHVAIDVHDTSVEEEVDHKESNPGRLLPIFPDNQFMSASQFASVRPKRHASLFLSRVPDDLLAYIISFLTDRNRVAMQRVCKQIKVVANKPAAYCPMLRAECHAGYGTLLPTLRKGVRTALYLDQVELQPEDEAFVQKCKLKHMSLLRCRREDYLASVMDQVSTLQGHRIQHAIPLLSRASNLTFLRFWCQWDLVLDLSLWSKWMPNLKVLIWSDGEIVMGNAPTPSWPSLQTLLLRGKIECRTVPDLSPLQSVDDLGLNWATQTDIKMSHLPPKLISLRLGNMNVLLDDVRQRYGKQLEWLEFEQCKVSAKHDFCQAFPAMKQITVDADCSFDTLSEPLIRKYCKDFDAIQRSREAQMEWPVVYM